MTFNREKGLKTRVLIMGLISLTVLFAVAYYHAFRAVRTELVQADAFDGKLVDIYYGADDNIGRRDVHETLVAKR